MRKLRVGLALVMSGCMMVSVGCGQNSQDSETADRDIEQNETVQAELYCDVDWWHPPAWSVEEGTTTGDITARTGVELKTTVPQQDADKQLSLMLLNDELPDLITVTDSTVISQLVSSGKVWKLDEFLQKYCPDSHLLTEFPEDMKEALIQRDGAWYAYPSHINSADARKIWKPCDTYYEDLAQYNTNNGIMWNRNLLEKLGLSIEELSTEEQVTGAWRKAKNSDITVKGQKVVPLLIDGSSYWNPTFKYLQYTFGAEYIDENGNYKDIMLQPESRHALSFLNRAYYKGYFLAEQINYTNDEVKSKIADGNVLCFIGNLSNTGMDASEWISSGAILSSDGKKPVLGKDLHANTGWLQTFISKECQNPEKIAGFLDYMTSEEGMLRWKFGSEGIDYSTGEDGLIYLTEEQKKKNSDYSKNGTGAWWMFTNTAWERSVAAPPDEDSIAAQAESIENAFGKDSHTVVYDTSAFENHTSLIQDTELEEADMNISTLKKKWISRIVLSGSDTEFAENYEKMLNEFNAYRITQIDADKNITFQKNKQKMGINLEKINK